MAIISGSEISSPSKNQVKINSPGKKKRNNCPGIRVKGARIYDSKDGKTCHQCRQKTLDFSAACMKLKEGKLCTVRFCHKCLLNRYGEQAEVVAQSGDWNCPRCRGICNCSVCMKRKGLQPTGQLFSTAKASGFSSVSHMLQVSVVVCEGSENAEQSEAVATEKDISTNISQKQDKENMFDRKIDPNLQAEPSSSVCAQKKFTKAAAEVVNETGGQSPVSVVQGRVTRQSGKKAEILKEVSDVNVTTAELENGRVAMKLKYNGDLNNCKVGDKKQNNIKRKACTEIYQNGIEMKTSTHPEERKFKKPKKVSFEDEEPTGVVETTAKKSETKEPIGVVKTILKKSETTDIVLNEERKGNIFGDKAEEMNHKKFLQKDCSNALGAGTENISKPHIPLPQGIELMNVSGIEIPSEDVGNVLQFLEFCSVFGKVIDLKKGQAESVVRDILHGRTLRQGKHSSTVQFLIQLLSVIYEDEEDSPPLSPRNGKNSWTHSLKQCISESRDVAKLMDLDLLDEGTLVYESLSSSKKLKLLNFLCDEILGTSKLREWIDEQTAKVSEQAKEVKSKVLAAKEKEKSLKQKMQDDIAKAVIANNGVPLSISEYEAIISKIKIKAAEAHEEVLESQRLLQKGNQTSDAIRIEQILLDATDARAYWRLKCCSDKSDILGQDLGSGDTLAMNEKWFSFDDEQKDAIEKHISLQGTKRLRAKRLCNAKAKEVSILLLHSLDG